MKNLLIPFTSIAWYFVTYFTLFGVFISFPLMFSIGWFWLILLYSFMMGVVSLLYSVAAGASISILHLYKLSWISCIIHSITGLLAVIRIIIFYLDNPPTQVHSGIETELLSYMWSESPLKTILLVPGFLITFIGIIYVMVINPIYIKIQMKESEDFI